jgi:lipoate-protein ligase A
VLPADYVFGERKFGGNAQAITSKRWLHHTSLLWDYDQRNMAVLTNPKKQPAYRQVSSTLQLQISFDRQIARSCFGQSCVGLLCQKKP